MKHFFQGIAMIAEVVYTLFTDDEQARQLEYDNGGGEIDR